MCVNPSPMWLCSKPIRAFGNFMIKTRQYFERCQLNKEYVFFGENNNYVKRFHNKQLIYVPCGKCMTCLRKRSKIWSLRIGSEYLKYNKNCVLTLTYDDEHLPEGGLLYYKDVQLFLKRLRKYISSFSDEKIKFVCSCEYGKNNTLRPHYHLILLNYSPSDVNWNFPYKITRKGSKLYKSDIINKLWNKGFADIGICDYHSCRYIAQYCLKKAYNTNNHIWNKKNELSREKMICSLGIGFDYFRQNYKNIFDTLKCTFGGRSYPIPKYFINKCKELYPEIFIKYKERIKAIMADFVMNFDEIRRRISIESRYIAMYKIFNL